MTGMEGSRTSEELDIYMADPSLVWLEEEAWRPLQMAEESY